jgi:hypothetical protein
VAGAYDTAGFFYSACVRDTLVYAAAESSGLLVINAADPSNPRLIGTYDTPGTALGVELSGSLALVADGDYGLAILDVSDPTQPSLRSTFSTLDCANWVAAHGRYALVADGRAGLLVADIGDPGAPVRVSQLATGGYARQVSVRDSVCYLACSDGGLSAVNLADPARPEEVGWYRSGNSIWTVSGLGGYQAVSDDDAAVRILQGYNLGRPPPPDYRRLLKVTPNPFRDQAVIEILLERDAHVRASVYNIAGQLLSTIADKPLRAGTHTLQWPPARSRFAGGVYLLRVKAGQKSLVARLVMIK